MCHDEMDNDLYRKFVYMPGDIVITKRPEKPTANGTKLKKPADSRQSEDLNGNFKDDGKAVILDNDPHE